MSENTQNNEEQVKARFNRTIAIIIAVVTVFTAIITFLQGDAANKDAAATRDSYVYAIEALGHNVSGDAKVNYDYNVAYQTWYEMDLLAMSAENRGDEAEYARYIAIRDAQLALSPLLQEPYFTPGESDEPDIARYEADTYLVEVTKSTEKFAAAAVVQSVWDAKANTYIIHLTLLAVSLFMFGLAATIAGPKTRMIFSFAGGLFTLIAVVWAAINFATPVVDLRAQGNAIDDYAQGVGLAYQARHEEAIAAFDQAIDAAPEYANAYAERAGAYTALGEYDQAITDYETALVFDKTNVNNMGELAWLYYLTGDFDAAIAMNQQALALRADELWIQYDLALAQLANGDVAAAEASYQVGKDIAIKAVADAKEKGEEPPSFLWWGLEDAAVSIEDLLLTIDAGEGEPDPSLIQNQDAIVEAGWAIYYELKNLSVALEFTGKPPAAETTAEVQAFQFAIPAYDENWEITDFDITDTFPAETEEVYVLFDYANMADGQQVIFKVYYNGEEDPTWRTILDWDMGTSGSTGFVLSMGDSDIFVLGSGMYTVEMYVDNIMVQQGYFEISE